MPEIDSFKTRFLSQFTKTMAQAKILLQNAHNLKSNQLISIVGSILTPFLPPKYNLSYHQKLLYPNQEETSTEQDLIIWDGSVLPRILSEFPILPMVNISACLDVIPLLTDAELNKSIENAKKIRQKFKQIYRKELYEDIADGPILGLFCFNSEWKTFSAFIDRVYELTKNNEFSDNLDFIYIWDQNLIGYWVIFRPIHKQYRNFSSAPIYPFKDQWNCQKSDFPAHIIHFSLEQSFGNTHSNLISAYPTKDKIIDFSEDLKFYGFFSFIGRLHEAISVKKESPAINPLFFLTGDHFWISNSQLSHPLKENAPDNSVSLNDAKKSN